MSGQGATPLPRRFKAGSVAALLVWELVINVRMMNSGPMKLTSDWSRTLKVFGVWQLLFLIGFGLTEYFLPRPRLDDRLFALQTLGWAAPLLLLSLMGGFFSVFITLMDAGKWGLYLSAPIPFHRVVRLRHLQLALLNGALMGGFVLFPVANAGALTGDPRYLALYPICFIVSTAAVVIAMPVLGLLCRVFGLARSRSTVIAATTLIGLSPTLYAMLNPHQPGQLKGRGLLPVLQENPWLDWLLGAFAGHLLPLLLMAVLTAAGLWLAARWLEPVALQLAQHPELARPQARKERASASATSRSLFRLPPWPLLVLKEWRSIYRDGAQLTGMLTAGLSTGLLYGWLLLGGRSTPERIALGMVGSAALISSMLMPRFIGAEEAPTLLASAPRSRNQLLGAKVAAALVPVGSLVLLVCLALVAYDWRAAGVGLLFSLLAGGSVTALYLARPYRPQRRSFQTTGWPANFTVADLLAVVLLQAGWPLAARLALYGNGWAALVVMALLLVPLWGYWKDTASEGLLGY